MPANHWSDGDVEDLDPLDQLVYRSNLLGSDATVVNFGGGNTSIKVKGVDHLGRDTEVMWIKGSGSDLATITRAGFTPLRLDDVRQAGSRETMPDDDMVSYLLRCSLSPSAPRPSIETMLHAFLPFAHVDHTHPQAAIAFCCSRRGPELTQECFGDDVVWVSYVRPGFALAKLALAALERRPNATGMFLAKHGLVTWGETGYQSYARTIDILSKAESFLESHVDPKTVFGGQIVEPLDEATRQRLMLILLPILRGELSQLVGSNARLILNWDASPEVMRFVGSSAMAKLARTGAACPDHVMYTKFLPMILTGLHEFAITPYELADQIREHVRSVTSTYVHEYTNFFEEHREDAVPMLDPAPRVVLIPGLGMVTAGVSAWVAANTASLYRTAIAVMRWASTNGGYVSLTSKEAWDIEYWPLELFKLTLKPSPKSFAGRVALVTGGAGAIGSATTRRLLDEDAHVVISDLNAERSAEVVRNLNPKSDTAVRAIQADVSNEAGTREMFEETILAFGGLDVVIPNAGIASAASIEDTTVEEWDRVHGVLLRGYFLTCRAAFRAMKLQGVGGSIVINSSKNGLAAGKNALAYTTAKAAELHMARCLAEEGGPYGIRVNAVAPDAVIEGSGLWNREWREERARAYGFEVENIEEFYRQRNVMKVKVTADDVAETIIFLASERSAKTTGCILTVDGGLAVAYPR